MRVNTPNSVTDIRQGSHVLPPTFPVVLPVCRKLEIIEIVDELCPMKEGDHLTHGEVVEFSMLHMLQSPDRDPLYKFPHWAKKHNTHVLYGREPSEFNDHRVGRTLDAIYEMMPEIEKRVVTNALTHYDVKCQAIHWDLTSVTFSGAHDDSDLVCKGYGAGRVHERQLQVNLHVTNDGGIPVRSEAIAGSAHQAPLASEMLTDLRDRLPRSDLIIVSDRAGISYDNVRAYYRGEAYFLGPLQITDPAHKEALAAVPASDFRPLAYRSIKKPDDIYSYYPTKIHLKPQKRAQPLCVNALFIFSQRLQHQQADKRKRDIDKTLEKLEEVRGFLNRLQYARATYARKQLKKKVPQGLKHIVRYQLSGKDKELSLKFWVDEDALAHEARDDGRYILVYHLPEHKQSHDDIFKLWRDQEIIERRNRNLNSDLSIHPMWLHKDERIQALLLIHILALIVFTLIELCSVRAGLRSDFYHKLTATQIVFQFAQAKLEQLWVDGKCVYLGLNMDPELYTILRQLRFPHPTIYLRPPREPPPENPIQEDHLNMC